MAMKPFMDVILAMDENNSIAQDGKLPWGPIPTDYHWFLTLATATKDPNKRIALILGRLSFEDAIKFEEKYVSKWHFIVITSQPAEHFVSKYPQLKADRIQTVSTFDQAATEAKELLDRPKSMIESVVVFGGVKPYEQAIESKLTRRIYLTRIFEKFPQADTRVEKFDLKDFRRIQRSKDETLAEWDDRIVEENGLKYQFQVYEQIEQK